MGTRALAIGLFTAVFAAGAFRINSWPVSIFPQFQTIATDRERTLVLDLRDAAGRELPTGLATSRLRRRMDGARLSAMFRRIAASSPAERAKRAASLTRVLQRADPALGPGGGDPGLGRHPVHEPGPAPGAPNGAGTRRRAAGGGAAARARP